MAWLESLAAKQGAKEEELLTKPGDRSEEMPDWLRPGKDQAETMESPEPVAAVDETLPLEPISPQATEPDSLKPFPAEISYVEPQVESTSREGELESHPGEPEASIESPVPEVTLPETITPASVVPPVTPEEETAQPLNTEADSDAWLKDLMAGQNLQPVGEQPLDEAPYSEEVVEPTGGSAAV